MSKEINLQSKEGQSIFSEYSFFCLMRGLFFPKSDNFESGGIICGTAHENEQVINKPKARIIICGSPSVGTSIASKIAQLEKVVIVPIKSKQPVLGKINYIELR